VEPNLPALLERHGFGEAQEEPFPNDGWSGSRLTAVERQGRRAIIKRTSPALDWIVRATGDRTLREASVAEGPLNLPDGVETPYLGVARDRDAAALLMPDLSDELISWSEGAPPVETRVLDVVLGGLARLHGSTWWTDAAEPPWCPLDRRLLLLTPPAGRRYRDAGLAVGERFLSGWDAFQRCAPEPARDLVAELSADVGPLICALDRLPAAGLHGDLKLANVAVHDGGPIALIDWQMTAMAPVAVELGWLVVSNVALLPEPPEAVLARYHRHADPAIVGDWEAQVDLAWIVGLLLRGWRKGLDAEAGVPTGWGASGGDDLAWWCDRAVTAAGRRL
jgi:hypothetical protein